MMHDSAPRLGIAAVSGAKDSNAPGYDHLNWVRDNQLYFGEAIGGAQLENAKTYAEEFTSAREAITAKTEGIAEADRPTVVQLSAAGDILQANNGSAIGQENDHPRRWELTPQPTLRARARARPARPRSRLSSSSPESRDPACRFPADLGRHYLGSDLLRARRRQERPHLHRSERRDGPGLITAPRPTSPCSSSPRPFSRSSSLISISRRSPRTSTRITSASTSRTRPHAPLQSHRRTEGRGRFCQVRLVVISLSRRGDHQASA